MHLFNLGSYSDYPQVVLQVVLLQRGVVKADNMHEMPSTHAATWHKKHKS